MYSARIFLVLLSLGSADSDLSDEVSMMQGGLRVSRTSNLDAAVQKAVQELTSAQNKRIDLLEKEFLQRAEDLKQKNEELSRSNDQMREKLAQHELKHDQLIEQMQDKLNQQEINHANLRKEHRLSYGMLLQVCEKGLRGVARTHHKGGNMTYVAMRKKQKFIPNPVKVVTDIGSDIGDGIEDGYNAGKDAVEDGYNAAADGVNSAIDSISDLPGDVADWTLDQLENLKSLVGLFWNDIPGLSDAIDGVKDFATDAVDAAIKPIQKAIDEIADGMNSIKEFTVDAVNSALDAVKGWVEILDEQLKSVTNYVSELYNKYLKPLITHVWDCAKDARSPIQFIVCMVKPVLEKLFDSLIPSESVEEKIPFPFDDEALQIDPETGVYTMRHTCSDCVEGDFRDLAPLKCQKKEVDYHSILKVTAHACNVPFMPGQCGGSFIGCLKKKAKQCARGAMLWSTSGVLTKLSGPVEQALQISLTTLQNVSHYVSEARALHEKAKTFMTSSEQGVKDVMSKFTSVLDNAQDLKDAVVGCLTAVGKISSASSLNKMVKFVEDVIASVETVISAVAKTQASFEALQTSISSLSSSTESEVQDFYTRGTSDMQALKNDIDTTKNDLMQLYEDSKGVAEELLDDFQAALAAPLDQLEDLGSMVQKCVSARESYQKVYLDIEVATMTVGRLVLHERDGIKLAFVNPKPGDAEIWHEEWSWADLSTHEGEEITLCLFVYCLKFNMRVRKNPSNILGLKIDISDGMDALKWLELEYKEFFYDFNVIGVPYKFKDPTGIRIPSIALPLLLDTSAPAQNPTTNPTDVANTLGQLVDQNMAEAQQIADGLVPAPGLPAGAASASSIDEIKTEVDDGLNLDGTSPTLDNSGAISSFDTSYTIESGKPLPLGLKDGDFITVRAIGHHNSSYLGLCAESTSGCDSSSYKAYSRSQPAYWQIEKASSKTFYLRSSDHGDAYLGFCGGTDLGQCDSSNHNLWGYSTKKDGRTKMQFEVDVDNKAYLRAAGHHSDAYVGFCGNAGSVSNCASAQNNAYSYITKPLGRAYFQVEKASLPLGLDDGDVITVRAIGHHDNNYLGLCPMNSDTCDGSSYKAYSHSQATYWRIERASGTTFYLRSADQGDAYLGFCGGTGHGQCDSSNYNIWGYSTTETSSKKDRTKFQFEVDTGNQAYLRAAGHHSDAYVGFCGNAGSVSNCASAQHNAYAYTTKPSGRSIFQIEKVSLPFGLKHGDTITIKADGHHANAYLGLCPMNSGGCDGSSYQAKSHSQPTYWRIERASGTTFYLSNTNQGNAYLGFCDNAAGSCDSSNYHVWGYSTKKDGRTKWQFEVDGDKAFLKASGHHNSAYVGFCGNAGTVTDCGVASHNAYGYVTKLPGRSKFIITKV